ncbi:MAG: glycosyltransferase [Alphaproteobacteria bacterium]|nr:glycosyltransferase [Alphaproteobacteria bacterium]
MPGGAASSNAISPNRGFSAPSWPASTPFTPAGDDIATLLIFEPDAQGHQREWLEHLIDHAAAIAPDATLWIVAAPELQTALAARLNDRVRLLVIKPAEAALCRHSSLLVSGFARWWLMRRYARRVKADACHFLALDHLSLPLALGLGIDRRRLSGILFRPSVHYGAIGPYAPSLAERLRDLRKAVLYRLMLRHRDLATVLTLDPYFTRHAEINYAGGNKLRSLPDPVYPVGPPANDGDASSHFPADRQGFLLFGYLTERKGVLVLLEALARLDAATASRISVLLAGRLDPAIRDDVTARCRALAQSNPLLVLKLADRWFDGAELDALVIQSAVVLAPYQRFVGSSGVLLWAARAGRPVLAQDFGLIGRLVEDNRLGLTVDASDPASLAAGIARMATDGPTEFVDAAAAQDFATRRTPRSFATAVYASLQGG